MDPTADNHRRIYFQPDAMVRLLPDAALQRIGLSLLADIAGRDWRALGDCLNYSATQLDVFAAGHYRANPGYGLLRDWATKERSTVGALRATLERIERHDVIVTLDDIVQNPIDLYVVIHDLDKHPSLNAEIRGRLELWEGLIPYLEGHLQNQNELKRYSFCELSNSAWKWRKLCHSLKGQQIDVRITHENRPTLSSMKSDSLEELTPQWHLVTPSILRFSRVTTTTGHSNTTATLVQCSGNGEDNSTIEHGRSTGHSSVLAAPTARNQCTHSRPDFETDDATNRLHETLHLRSGLGNQGESHPVQCSSGDYLGQAEGPYSRISLRSDEGSERGHSPVNLARAMNLRSPVENEYFGLEISAESLLRQNSLNCDPESPTNDYFVAVDGHAREMMSKGNRCPVAKSQHNPIHEATTFNSQHRHDHAEVSSENNTNSADITKRRVCYGLPSAEAIRQEFPELLNVPGFHPKLKHKISLVRLATKSYEKTDGWYLIRTYNCDDDPESVQLALSVSHGGRLKHYQILNRRISSGARRYYLFNNDYEATTISHLIDHYKTHPLVPRGYGTDPAGGPTLVEPIPDDSSCLTVNE